MGKSELYSLTSPNHLAPCGYLALPQTVQTHRLPSGPNNIRHTMIRTRTTAQHPQVQMVKVRCLIQWIRCRLAAWIV